MSINFIFCLHNHQPVGNFEHVFQWGFDNCYGKTIDILMEYPEFRFAVHHSGPLLEWIMHNEPDYLEKLKKMSERNQLEIIGGGFYEPIFSIISPDDVKGQIAMMQEFCLSHFNTEPRGFWTAERVWDPEIPRLVQDFNFEYTILDDNHFRYAGLSDDAIGGYYITERLDSPLNVYPIDRFLRYSIPFKLPEDTINYLRKKADVISGLSILYGDDGEKFGMWPGTFDWVFGQKWLINFIEALLKEDWIHLTLPSEYIERKPPQGRIYLTQGSYFELSEWALPAGVASELTRIKNELKEAGRDEEFYPFLKGGVWNNFLNKYPESNAINKRTLLLSREISKLPEPSQKEAITELYRSECNCAYWHGHFGGIYLAKLRNALYEHLLAAERLYLESRNISGLEIQEKDFWNDGKTQILIRQKDMSVIIQPGYGGSISEIGSYKHEVNLCNVLPRRPEAYHNELQAIDQVEAEENTVKSIHEMKTVREKGLERYLVYDFSRRYSFKEMVFQELPSPEDLLFGKAEFLDYGNDPYEYEIKRNPGGTEVILNNLANGLKNDHEIVKKYYINEQHCGIKCDYKGIKGNRGFLGIELNVNMMGEDEKHHYLMFAGENDRRSLLSTGAAHNVTGIILVNDVLKFRTSVSMPEKPIVVHYPVYTVSQSDKGFEKNYQGICLVVFYQIKSEPLDFSISMELKGRV